MAGVPYCDGEIRNGSFRSGVTLGAAGREVADAVCVDSYGSLVYDLGGMADSFSAEAGIDEEAYRDEVRLDIIVDRKLKEWSGEGGDRRRIQATWFVPDETKAGGTYVTAEGVVKKVDGYEKVLILEDGSRIRTEDIIRLEELSPEKGETGEEKLEKQAKGGNEGI